MRYATVDGFVTDSAFVTTYGDYEDWNCNPSNYTACTLYDGLGRASATIWPSNTPTDTRVVTRNAYDSAGRAKTLTYHNPDGSVAETITTSYDMDSKVTATTMSHSGYSIQNTYDNLDRITGMTASGPAGTTNFTTTYDVADLPLITTWSAFGVTRSTDTTYAKTGELTRMTVEDGTAAGTTHYFAFDVAGRLTRSASGLGTRLLAYDPAGRLASVSMGRPGANGLLANFAAQRLGYDGWERLTSVSTTAAVAENSSNDTYTYDAAGRIKTWSRTGFGAGNATYDFDAAGNLTSKLAGGLSTTYAYNAANQLTTETAGSVVTTHTYDEFGRLAYTSGPAASAYAYDVLGKLSSVTRLGMSASYSYGISGMRESKAVTSAGVTKTTKSVWSGMTLVAEADSDGTRYEYIYGAGVPLELVVTPSGGASTRYGYQVDAAGSVIGITDAAGTVIANYAYDPYGVPTATSGTDPIASRNPLRYRGYYYDDETGLYYLPARYYEPRSARFLSVDPAAPEAGDPASLNRYAYCLGDPVNASDPTGAITWWRGSSIRGAISSFKSWVGKRWRSFGGGRHAAYVLPVTFGLA
ncbi:MAG: hypothetical protein CVT60_02560 [Actinobacteria bacterium HGW-Actinobacteria-10]|nr:MAG: hypothetical protein CVT60_02560 [Actinobacteria bacterium HGW-Actinobacteria-10]